MPTKLTNRMIVLCLLVAALLPRWASGQQSVNQSPTPIQVFEIQEHYAVAHPDQIIDFELAGKIDPANASMIGPDGKPAVFQLLEDGKKVAVRTNLMPGGKRSWRLVQGRPPMLQAGTIEVEDQDGRIEIRSGATGVRLPVACNAATTEAGAIPAPLQGIRLYDGTWIATGCNGMKLAGKLRKMQVRFLEKGPLKVVVEVAYEVERPERTIARGQVAAIDPVSNALILTPQNYLDRVRVSDVLVQLRVGSGARVTTLPAPLVAGKSYHATRVGVDAYQLADSSGGVPVKLGNGLVGNPAVFTVLPGGSGVAKTTITVEAGQPSILIEEEADVEASYAIDFGTKVKLNQARYRGHHSNSARAGYEKDGRTYRQSHERQPADAFFEFPFDRDYRSNYNTNLDQWPSIRRLAVWDPWVFDSGWYWQAYDKDGGDDSPLIGLFAGRASRAVWAGNSGAGFFTRCANNGGPAVGIEVQMNLGSPDASVYPRVRFQWGIFTGSKGYDLAPPDQVQPIARQMNLHAGINLNKIYRLDVDFPDPPQGYGSPYMDRGAVDRMIERLQKDTSGMHGRGYHHYLAKADPAARDLIAIWADTSAEKIRTVDQGIDEEARSLLDGLVNGDGIYAIRCHYWHGGLAMSRKLLWIDQVLGAKVATPEMKARAKAAAVLFAAILWDNDFVPMFQGHGLNLGTPNMPVQQQGYRNQYALFLVRHSMAQGLLEGAVQQTAHILGRDINEFGAHMACIHYVGAGMGPTLTMMQQLKTAGVKDFFHDEPRVACFAEFYMNCTTPPEPRFGGRRKNISVGDSATEPSELFGQMATGFADVDPALSKRLAGLWQAQGKPHSSFHGTTLLKIDEDLPATLPQLRSANFPGQFSVLRSGWNTPHETAVWLVNGNFYWDHSHCDQGEVVLYALGAPLSLDWGPIYTPRVAGAFYHNVALPESVFPHPWDKDNPSLDAGNWGTYAGTKTTQEEFHAADDGGWVRVRMKAPDGKYTWTRAVSLARLAEDLPVIAIQDSYTGEAATAAKVFTLNLMAEGPVETPEGNVNPPERLWGYGRHFSDRQELASAGQVIALRPGVNRLGFTGQAWKAHPSEGIDFSVYVVAEEEVQAQVGNWAHASGSTGADEFHKTNGREFEERQHILRLRSLGGFRVFLAAYPKKRKPSDLRVQSDGAQVVVSLAGRTVRFDAEGKHSGG